MKLGRHRRTWTFVLVGAILGAVVGLLYSLNLDEVCFGGRAHGRGDVFACGYRSFVGWEIVPLAAWALWAAVGATVGSLLLG